MKNKNKQTPVSIAMSSLEIPNKNIYQRFARNTKKEPACE